MNGETLEVDTMFLEDKFKYKFSYEDNFAMIELPYAGDVASMVIIMPRNLGRSPKEDGGINYQLVNESTKL